MADLAVIDVSDCRFVGTIPSEIGELTHLLELRIGRTSMRGIIPTEIGRLTSLQKFEVNSISLEGTIPSQIGLLKSLGEFQAKTSARLFPINRDTTTANPIRLYTNYSEVLNLEGNFFNGSLPTEIGLCTLLGK